MKKLLAIITASLLIAACEKKNNETEVPQSKALRTVIVYMSAENNLSSYGILSGDLYEMKTGSKSIPANNRLVVFVDDASTTKPYIAEIKDGACDTLKTYDEDFYASEPSRFSSVISTIVEQCPSDEYGLVLWGHATGWLITADSIAEGRSQAGPRKAYGADSGNNNGYSFTRWMNITQMERAMRTLPHFRFIFADCCAMMNVEVAYELRQHTDFLIGSPAEIPGLGAPYSLFTKDFFLQTDSFYRAIIDDYFDHYASLYQTADYVYDTKTSYLKGHSVPLSVVDMRYIEDLAAATRQLLLPPDSFPTDSVPFYFWTDMPIMYDMGCMMQRVCSPDDYAQWCQALNRAVPYRRFSARWMTVYEELKRRMRSNAFRFNKDNYSGLSLYIPMSVYNFSYLYQYNTTIQSLAWYGAVGWERFMDN